MPRPFLIFSHSDYLFIQTRLFIQIRILNDKQYRSRSVDIQKPTDLDLHCLQRQDIPRFSRTWVLILLNTFTNSISSLSSQIVVFQIS